MVQGADWAEVWDPALRVEAVGAHAGSLIRPHRPVGAALKYGLMTAATSNGAASKFADMVAGPQAKKKNQN